MSLSLHEHLWNLNADVQKAWLRQAGAWDKTLTRKARARNGVCLEWR